LLLLAWITGSGCSLLRRSAPDQVANAVARSGTTFASEEDPDLVKAAAPFSLKLMESLLAETPQHQGLLSAAASGLQYAFAFVQQEADELEARDLAAAEALRTRARRLYLRAQHYGLRGLEVEHPGFPTALLANPRAAVGAATN
jgi:predicted anti-sigma-YlaC factor YlaD